MKTLCLQTVLFLGACLSCLGNSVTITNLTASTVSFSASGLGGFSDSGTVAALGSYTATASGPSAWSIDDGSGPKTVNLGDDDLVIEVTGPPLSLWVDGPEGSELAAFWSGAGVGLLFHVFGWKLRMARGLARSYES